MALTHQQIADFYETTINRYFRGELVDISMPLQKYHFASRWFKSKKKPERGGALLEWKLRTGNQGNAKHSGLFAVDDTDRKNVVTRAKTGWSKQTVNYIFDADEPEFQSGPETIYETAKLNEQGLFNDIFQLMETSMWTAPASSSEDPMPPAGIPFWIQKCAALGFNGGDPSGWSDGAGNIKTATYPAWKNYGGPYVQVSRDDLIEKVINACDFCYFEPVAKFNELDSGEPAWGFYTVHSVLSTMRKLLQANNDNLGPDVARYAGQVLIKGIPVEWVPALDNAESEAYDSTNPFYGINWTKFYYYFKTGRNMIKHPLKHAAHQHTVWERHMDNWGNFSCSDRRQGGFQFHVAA